MCIIGRKLAERRSGNERKSAKEMKGNIEKQRRRQRRNNGGARSEAKKSKAKAGGMKAKAKNGESIGSNEMAGESVKAWLMKISENQ